MPWELQLNSREKFLPGLGFEPRLEIWRSEDQIPAQVRIFSWIKIKLLVYWCKIFSNFYHGLTYFWTIYDFSKINYHDFIILFYCLYFIRNKGTQKRHIERCKYFFKLCINRISNWAHNFTTILFTVIVHFSWGLRVRTALCGTAYFGSLY